MDKLYTAIIKDENSEWEEEFTLDEIKYKEQAEGIIISFNNTLGPLEKPRKLVSIKELGMDYSHQWVKFTGGMSVIFRGSIVDLVFCSRCGVTGKRYGMSKNVTVDSKYKKKMYLDCKWYLISKDGE